MFGFLKKTVKSLVEEGKNSVFSGKDDKKDDADKGAAAAATAAAVETPAAKTHTPSPHAPTSTTERPEPQVTAPATTIATVETTILETGEKREHDLTIQKSTPRETETCGESEIDALETGRETEIKPARERELETVKDLTIPETERAVLENEPEPPLATTTPVDTTTGTTAAASVEPLAGVVPPKKKKSGFGARLLDTIGKMRKRTSKVLSGVQKVIEERELKESDVSNLLWEFNLNLIQSNIAPEVSDRITNNLKRDIVGSKIKRGSDIERLLKKSLKKSLEELLDVEQPDFLKLVTAKKPCLVLFIGFNGSGKTTTIAKVCRLLQEHKLRCVLAAGDSFRAASIEQLEVHGKRLGVKVVKQDYGSDSAAIIFDAVSYANAHDIDIVLADTAGRVHTDTNLMRELEKIVRVNKPDLKLLVLDSLSGTDIINQSKLFDDAVSIDGIVLTKYDVDEKGGAAISAVSTVGKPIFFVGTGQEYEDLKIFDKDEFISSVLEWDENAEKIKSA